MAFPESRRGNLRLPTPPTDEPDDVEVHKAVNDALKYLEDSLSSPIEQNQPQANNNHPSRPNTPPPSSPIPDKANNERIASEQPKQLRFCEETSFCEGSEKSLLPSRLQQPAKSILKPFDFSVSASPAAPRRYASGLPSDDLDNFGAMLESALKSLARQDIISRRDAWSTLWTSMKAFQDFPSNESLRNSLSMLEQFLKRDIVEPKDIAEPSIRQLKLQASQFAQLLIWKYPPVKEANIPLSLSTEFATFLIDHSIQASGSDSVSKDLLRNYLGILASPGIHGQMFTPERATRCIKALHGIPSALAGKSVVQSRLLIFAHIARNHPEVAAEAVNQIFPHLMRGLASDFSPSRARAVESSLNFAISIGLRSRVAKAVWSWLQSQDSGKGSHLTLIEDMLHRLLLTQNRTDSNNEAHFVPQIWGIINLLVGGHPPTLLHLLTRPSWTQLEGACFNSSDIGLNLHAWMAWDRTIFAAQHLLRGDIRILNKLCYPIIGCLRRRNHDEDDMKIKHAVHQSFRLILYYTLGQKLQPDWMKTVWLIAVGGFCRHILKDEVDDLFRLGQTLCALFSESALKFRNPKRALEVSIEPLHFTEVPKLEPSWIRSNAAIILKSLAPLLRQRSPSQHYVVFVHPVWTSLMKGIAQAGEKEIKASDSLRNAIADLLNFLRTVWKISKNESESQASVPSIPMGTLTALLKVSIDVIGPLHWGERLILQTSSGLWTAAGTPSKQDVLNHRPASPIASTIALLSHPPSDAVISPTFRIDISHMLHSCLIPKSTLTSRLDMLLGCSKSLPRSVTPDQHPIVPVIWQSIMERIPSNLDELQDTDCYTILRIMSFGLYLSDKKSLETGRGVFKKLSALVHHKYGDAGFVSILAHPWLEMLSREANRCKNATLQYFSLLIECYPPIHHSKVFRIEQSSRHDRSQALAEKIVPWPEFLYKMIGAMLSSSYSSQTCLDLSAIYHFLSVLRNFLIQAEKLWLRIEESPALPLLQFQDGLLCWVRDEDDRISRFQDRGFDLGLPTRSILNLMFEYLATNLPFKYGRLPTGFEELFLGAFRSSSKATANVAIQKWNAMLERCENIEYSPHLAFALEKLSDYAHVQLSSTHQKPDPETCDIAAPSEDSEYFPWLQNSEPEESKSSQHRPKNLKPPTFQFERASAFSRPTPASNAVSSRRNLNNAQNQPRLRHDDSQIQFLPIESSPASHAGEMGSQYMTEHQKDVRSRQAQDAAVLPDVGSSPTPYRARHSSAEVKRGKSRSNASTSSSSNARQEGNQEFTDAISRIDDISSPNERGEESVPDEDRLADAIKAEKEESVLRGQENDSVGNGQPAVRHSSEEGICVDSSSRANMRLDNDERSAGHSPVVYKSNASGLRGPAGPLQNLSPNMSHLHPNSSTGTDKQARSIGSVDCIEDSFPPAKSSSSVGKVLDPGSSQNGANLEKLSPSREKPSGVPPESQTREEATSLDSSISLDRISDDRAFGSHGAGQLEEVSPKELLCASSQEAAAPSQQASQRKRKRKRKQRSSYGQRSTPNTSQVTTYTQEDASDEVITVAVPDSNSPSLRTVLERLGILVGEPKTPLSRRTPSASQLSAATKRKRSSSIISSKVTQDASVEKQPSGKKRRTKTASSSPSVEVESSQVVSSPMLSCKDADKDDRGASPGAAVSAVSRLKSLVEEVGSLSFGPEDDEAKRKLLKLSKKLHKKIKTVTGMK